MRDGGERILGLGRGGGFEGKGGGFPSGDAAGDFGDLGVAGALEQAGGDAGAVAAGVIDGGRGVSAARLVWVSFFVLRSEWGWLRLVAALCAGRLDEEEAWSKAAASRRTPKVLGAAFALRSGGSRHIAEDITSTRDSTSLRSSA